VDKNLNEGLCPKYWVRVVLVILLSTFRVNIAILVPYFAEGVKARVNLPKTGF
jgi:hypothetical protein